MDESELRRGLPEMAVDHSFERHPADRRRGRRPHGRSVKPAHGLESTTHHAAPALDRHRQVTGPLGFAHRTRCRLAQLTRFRNLHHRNIWN